MNLTVTRTPQEQIHTLLMAKDDRPLLARMTDEEWQPLLCYLKSINRPTKENTLKRKSISNNILGRKWGLSDNEYRYETADASYVHYIVDVLKQIRGNRVDYAHHTYHVMEILRFEPDLEAKLVDGVIHVRLHKNKVCN